MRSVLIEGGCVDALTLSAGKCETASDLEVRLEAIATIYNLSLGTQNGQSIIRTGIVPSLIDMLKVQHDSQIGLVCGALANMAEGDQVVKMSILMENGIEVFIDLLNSKPSVKIKCEEIIRCLVLLSMDKSFHDNFLDLRLFVALKHVLVHESGIQSKIYTTLVIANLAQSKISHDLLLESQIFSIYPTLLTMKNAEFKQCIAYLLHNITRCFPENHQVCLEHNFFSILSNLFDFEDELCRVHACLSFRYLSLSNVWASAFIESCSLTNLLPMIKSGSVEIQKEIVGALRNLSLNSQIKANLLQQGFAPALIMISRSSRNDLIKLVYGVIANLAEIDDSTGIIVEAGFLHHSSFTLKSTYDDDVKRECLRTLSNLSQNSEFSRSIGNSELISSLIHLVSSSDERCQCYAVLTISNISTNIDNRRRLIEDGCVYPLLHIYSKGNVDQLTKNFCFCTLSNLSASKDVHGILLDNSILNICSSIIESYSEDLFLSSLTCLANLASSVRCHIAIEKSQCLPLVVSSINRIYGSALIQSLFFLRGLSTSQQMRLKLIQMEVVEKILRLLPQDKMIEDEILHTLCNLSIDYNFGDHNLINMFDLDGLLRSLHDGNICSQIFSCIFIGNAVSRMQHNVVIQSYAVEALITASESSYCTELKRCVAYALCNMSFDYNYRTFIAKSTGIRSILYLVDSVIEIDVYNAVTTIRAISEEMYSIKNFAESGCIDRLIDVCRRRLSDRCTYSALEAIYWLSVMDESKEIILSDRNSHCLMSFVSQNGSEFQLQILLTAFRIISNCSEILGLHSCIISLLPDNFLTYTSYGIEFRREVTRILSNLFSTEENHERLLKNFALDELLQAQWLYDDHIIRKYACHAILNLSINSATHPYLYEFRNELSILLLCDLLDEDNSPNYISIIRTGCTTVGCLFSFGLFHEYFEKRGVLYFLCNLLSFSNEEIKLSASFSIHQFYKFSDVKTGDLPFAPFDDNLLMTLFASDDNIIIHSLAAFGHLVRKVKFSNEFVTRKGLHLLCDLAHKSSAHEMKRMVMVVLFSVTSTSYFQHELCLNEAFDVALKLCNCSDHIVLRFAIATLANVSERMLSHSWFIAEQGLIARLVFYLSSKDIPVKRESLRIVSNLITSAEVMNEFITAQGLKALERLSKSLDAELKCNCALCFRKIAFFQQSHKRLITEGCLRTILRLIGYHEHNSDAARHACSALIDVARCKDVLRFLPKTDVIHTVIELLSCGHDSIEILGAAILSTLSVSLPLVQQIMNNRAFQSLCYSIRDEKCSGYLTYIAATLSNLCHFDDIRLKIWKHENLLEVLQNLIRKNNDCINMHVARIIALLSIDVSDSLPFELESYLIQISVDLIQSSSNEVVLIALIGIGNFARDRKHQILLRDLSAFGQIESVIISSTGEVLSNALWVLSRICIPDENLHLISHRSRLLQRFVDLIQSKDHENLEYLSHALCNILSNENARLHLVHVNLIPALIRSVQKNDPEKILPFAKALCNSLLSGAVRSSAVEQNAIITLLRLSRSHLQDCREAAILAFCNICIDSEFCKASCAAGVMKSICLYIHLDQLGIRRKCAVLTFYSISRHADCHRYLADVSVIQCILSLCENSDVDCRSLALMTLSNLSANEWCQRNITKYRGLQTAVSLLSDLDLNCQISACILLSNLLISPTVRSQSVFHGCIPALKSLLSSKNHSLHLHAKLALINITPHFSNHPHLLKYDVFNLLFDNLHGCDILTGLIIANVTANEGITHILTRKPALSALTTLISHSDIHLCCCGLFALQPILNQELFANVFQAPDFFNQLAQISLNDEADLHQAVAKCIEILSGKAQETRCIGRNSMPLIELLLSRIDPETLSYTASIIANLSIDKSLFIPDSILKKLLSLLDHKNMHVKRQACRAVAMMSDSSRSQDKIIEYGGLVKILPLLREIRDDQSEFFLSRALNNLSRNDHSHAIIIESGLSDVHRILLKKSEVNTASNILKALAGLSTSRFGDVPLICKKLVPPICDYLESDDPDLITLSAFILLRLSLNHHFQREIMNEGTIILKVARAIRGGCSNRLSYLSGLLANLSLFDSNRAILIENGIVSTLISLFRHSDQNRFRDVFRAFANLSTTKTRNFSIYEEGGFAWLMNVVEALDHFSLSFAVLSITLLCTNAKVRSDILNKATITFLNSLKRIEKDECRLSIATIYALFSSVSDKSYKQYLVPECLPHIMVLCQHDHILVQKNATAAVSNIAECDECHGALFDNDAVRIMTDIVSTLTDSDTIRDWSRFFAVLSFTHYVREEIFSHKLIPFIVRFGRRAEISTQRYSVITLCNLCWCLEKSSILLNGNICRTVLYLSECSDLEVEKSAMLCLCALTSVANKQSTQMLVELGALDSLLKALQYPDVAAKQHASLALNLVFLGCSDDMKISLLKEKNVIPVFLSLLDIADDECIHNAVFAIGTLIEHAEIRNEITKNETLDVLASIFCSVFVSTKVKRSCAYIYCVLSEHKEYHHKLREAGVIQMVVDLAGMLDEQCQMYGSLSLVFLSSNSDLQVYIANKGAIRNLVSILSTESSARHFAGIALLKLAENLETHITIAKEGGIKALLTLSKGGSANRYLKYKAAYALSSLASETLARLPKISYSEKDKLKTKR